MGLEDTKVSSPCLDLGRGKGREGEEKGKEREFWGGRGRYERQLLALEEEGLQVNMVR